MAYPSPVIAPEHAALLGHRIDKNRLKFMSVLGLGAYGVVYLAQDVSAEIGMSSAYDPSSPYSGKGYYAVKCLNKTGLDQRQKSFQRREIALHTLASQHDNIVSMHRVVETSSIIYVILAFCPDGDLFSMITEQSRYLGDDELIRSVFLQIVDSIDYCHQLGIYHRDLKPENILCCDGGKRVLLADFGLATTEKISSDFGCGSTFYMSPECQGGIHHRVSSYSTLHNDIWSLGVILVNLTCGRNPWKQATPSDETFRAYLDNRDFLRSILPISLECNELLKRIFALDPAERISIAEIRQRVQHMKRWTMTDDELANATKATKEAARGFPQPQPQAKAQVQAKADPVPAPIIETEPVFIQPVACSDSSDGMDMLSDPFTFTPPVQQQQAHTSPRARCAVKPLPGSPQAKHSRKHLHHYQRAVLQDSSNMDLDDDSSNNGSGHNRTPVIGTPKTPQTPQSNRRPMFRRRRGNSDENVATKTPSTRDNLCPSPPSSASSSSSSNEGWSEMPPTPDTPTFLRQMQQKARAEVDVASAFERIESLASSASSKASFETYYPEYVGWADAPPLDLPPMPSPQAVTAHRRPCDAKNSLAQLLSPMPRRIVKA